MRPWKRRNFRATKGANARLQMKPLWLNLATVTTRKRLLGKPGIIQNSVKPSGKLLKLKRTPAKSRKRPPGKFLNLNRALATLKLRR
ncbi:hypothetical protein Trydic_g21664 [Trypoxylus dichotomus]